MNMRGYFFLLCLFVATATPRLYAMEITPFRVTSQSPLIQIYGLPADSGAVVTQRGKHAVALSLDNASSSTSHQNNREQIHLDGEATRVTTSIRYGFGERFEAGMTVPVVNQGGGFLDQFIITWHTSFSLPQGERTTTQKNRLNYSYIKNGVQKLSMTKSGTSVGDIVLSGGMQLTDGISEQSRVALALRSELKLPTGDTALLAGSGSTDLALSLAGSYNRFGTWGAAGVFGSFGVLGMTRSDILPDQQNRLAVFGTAGAGWSPAERISFKLQLNGHSPLYRGSSLNELSEVSLMLTSGGTLKLGKSYMIDIGVSEDVAVATAPDVAFHFGVRREF